MLLRYVCCYFVSLEFGFWFVWLVYLFYSFACWSLLFVFVVCRIDLFCCVRFVACIGGLRFWCCLIGVCCLCCFAIGVLDCSSGCVCLLVLIAFCF